MTRAENAGFGSARTIIWIALAVIALSGVVVGIATSSWWPVVAVAGLALPMIPVRSSAQRR
jgi:hypothetical protein